MLFSEKTTIDIERSRQDAAEKVKRDAYSLEHGTTPEDEHSKVFAQLQKEQCDPRFIHERAAFIVRENRMHKAP